MIRSCTDSSTSILRSDSSSASTAPDTSPLMMRLSDSTLPSSRARVKSSSEMRLRALASWALRSAASRFSAIWRAVRSSSVTRKVSPARGTRVQTLHLHRTRRGGLEHGVAVLVHHGTDAAVGRSRDDRVADAERSGLDEHGGDGAATLVELGFDRDTARVLVRVRREVETGIRRQQHGVEQLLDADVVAGRHVDEHDVAAVLLGDQAELGELLAHLGRGWRRACRSC